VLLVDIGLPGLDGYGVARSVREKLGRSVYMVAITGYGQPDDRTRALEAGFDLHLIKPIDIAVLERLLSHEVLKLVC
jgi:CheY-like chemotaxis protein